MSACIWLLGLQQGALLGQKMMMFILRYVLQRGTLPGTGGSLKIEPRLYGLKPGHLETVPEPESCKVMVVVSDRPLDPCLVPGGCGVAGDMEGCR